MSVSRRDWPQAMVCQHRAERPEPGGATPIFWRVAAAGIAAWFRPGWTI